MATLKATLNPGDEVYSVHGEAGRYVARVANGHVVEPIIEPDDRDEAPYYADPVTWREVFAKPPVQRLHAEVAEVEKKLAAARDALAEVRAARSEFDNEERARLARIKQHKQLSRIDDYISGRITHVVLLGRYASDVNIQTLAEVQASECQPDRIPLLVLFGDPWRHHYKASEWCFLSDGNWISCYPCASLEEAQEKAREAVEEQFAAWRKSNYRDTASDLKHYVASARRLGLPVPEDAAATQATIERRDTEQALARSRSEVAKAQAAIAEAEARLAVLAGAEPVTA